jgi:hypothetical protein
MPTPFTKHRDGIAAHQNYIFDYGLDSLVYHLPHIDKQAKCQLHLEFYQPALSRSDNWKMKLDVDGTMQHTVNLTPGEVVAIEFNVPTAVNMDGEARIKVEKIRGDCVLLRRVLLFEYERVGRSAAMYSGGGPQGHETQYPSPILFESIYPNPARSNLTIKFTCSNEREVTIKLYDVVGRMVEQVFNGRATGVNEIPFAAENLAAGVYFVRIEAENDIINRKIVLLR